MEALTFDVIVVRILLAFILSAIIGFERETHQQAAGMRTHILICVGAALLMILSIYVPKTYVFGNGVADPGRIAAQVVSGIGFLGAGAILRYGFNVKGLTTAANIWVMAALGLTVGAGLYFPAIFGAGIILFTLIGIDAIEKRLFPPQSTKVLSIEFKEGKISFTEIGNIVSQFAKIKSSDLSKKSGKNIHVKFIVQIKEGAIDPLIRKLNSKIVNINLVGSSQE